MKGTPLFLGALVGCLVTSLGLAQTVTVSRVPTLGGQFVEVRGLNASGHVAGFSTIANDAEQHGFFWTGSLPVDLGTLGGTFGLATALNNTGLVVGESTIGGDVASHGFLFAGGALIDLGTLGGWGSIGIDVNDEGWVLGNSWVEGDVGQEPFLYRNGTLVRLGTLGGGHSIAIALNNANQVAGDSYNTTGEYHAFLYTGGSMLDLETLGGGYSTATALNDAGRVVGESFTSEFQMHAFMFDGVAMRDLGTLGGTYSRAVAVNNNHQVIGNSLTAGDAEYHGFVFQNETMTDLGTLGGNYSMAYAINNRGQVVGDSATSDGPAHAFLWQDGLLTDLNSMLPPGSEWELAAALFINDAGQIAGFGFHRGEFAWYLLSQNRPPIAVAGSDRTTECVVTGTTVELDGSGSTDPDGDTLAYEWRSGTQVISVGPTLSLDLPLGTNVITLRVTDPLNASSEDNVEIRVLDTTAPQFAGPSSLAASLGGNCQAPVPDMWQSVQVTDGCAPNNALTLTQTPAAGTLLGAGEHLVTLQATDPSGNVGYHQVLVTLQDVTAPTISGPSQLVWPAGTSCQATVPDLRDQLALGDNCTSSADLQVLQSPAPGTLLGLGEHLIVFTATDGAGNSATFHTTVTVNDVTPPVVASLVPSVLALSPVNRALHPVSLQLNASDNCGLTVARIISVTSNEPVTGQGDNTSPDWRVTGPLTLDLRAERAARGEGRVYTILVECLDAAGNRTTATTSVAVPKQRP